MPDPRFILSAKPPVELEVLLDSKQYSKINIYIDFKNIATSLYVEEVARDIVANSQYRYTDSTIFQAVLCTLSWWREYALLHKLESDIFFFTDGGKSSYHRSIHSGYKKSRAISNLRDPELFEDLFKIREKNAILSESVVNKIPRSWFLNLKFLEADFIPYYLITRYFSEDKDTLHVVVSNDKDMYQNLALDNVVQTFTKNGERKLVDNNTLFYFFTKLNKSSYAVQKRIIEQISKLKPEDITLAMSIVGDVADDVPGVKGLGPKKAIKMLSDIETYKDFVGSYEDLCDRVYKGESVFLKDSDFPDKEWETAVRNSQIVEKAFKLISFEMLSRWVDDENSIEKMNIKKYLDDALNKENTILNEALLKEAICRLEDCYVDESVITNIFREYNGE